MSAAAATISIFGFRIKIAMIALCCLVAQTTAAVVLTRYSKMIADTPNSDGSKKDKYSNSSLVVSTEFVKFVASLTLVFFFDTVDKLQAEAKSETKRPEDSSSPTKNPAPSGTATVVINPKIATVTTVNKTATGTGGETLPLEGTEASVSTISTILPSAEEKANGVSTIEMAALIPPVVKEVRVDDAPSGTLTDAVPPLLSGRGLAARYRAWKAILIKENFKDIFGTLKLAVPALLYTVQNNVIYTALNNLEATTFQVGYQSKVVTTAVLSVLMLNRSLTPLKWLALVILTTGIVLTQLQPATDAAPSKAPKGPIKTTTAPVVDFDVDNHNNQFIGMVAVMVASFCSAFAGVYFEKILKGTAPSVWVRNAQLAFFSMLVGIVGYLFSLDPEESFRAMDYFKGYDILVLMLISVQALGGLIIACVVKYADNILKGFATAMSIVLCGILSAMFMGFFPNFMFVLGSSVVIFATMLYSKPDKK